MTPTPFSELAGLCRSLEATSKRKEKTGLLAGFLRGLEPEEVGPALFSRSSTPGPSRWGGGR
jgi:hypothetical protein